MQKVNWQGEGDHIRLAMPISKVDTEQRLVFGWASLDNIDQHRDLVDANASRTAFEKFRGNIREQHDEKKAVGRLVDFREDTLFYDGKFYQGIYVTAYVSKGAPDTWEKVMDGTLSGFSIGGNVLKAENAIDPSTGEPFRKVTDYMLTELSLVDNPANQLADIAGFQKANVLSLAKMADSDLTVLTGDLADIKIENIFVCNVCLDKGHGVHKSSEESLSCPVCDSKMIQIGFVESSDPAQKETIQKMIDGHLADREGGVTETMADNNTEEVVEATAEVEVEEVQTDAAAEEAAAPAAEETVEVEEVNDPLTDAVSALRELTDRIEENAQAQRQENEELRKSLENLDKSFEERLGTIAGQVGALEKRHQEFSEKFEGIDATFATVQKGLGELDASTALRKSADFDQPAEEEKPRGFWAGSLLTND